jgi:hypothetical protein
MLTGSVLLLIILSIYWLIRWLLRCRTPCFGRRKPPSIDPAGDNIVFVLGDHAVRGRYLDDAVLGVVVVLGHAVLAVGVGRQAAEGIVAVAAGVVIGINQTAWWYQLLILGVPPVWAVTVAVPVMVSS